MKVTSFNEDKLALKAFAERLEKFIEIEKLFVDDSLVLGLTSKYGSGKTTFIEMWKNYFETKEGDKHHLVVSLNAWESDYYGDPLFAIVSELINALPKSEKKTKKLKDAANKIGRFSLSVGNQVVAKFTGLNIMVANDFSKESEKENKLVENIDAFTVFNERKQALYELKRVIEEVLSIGDREVLFLVDELDRCRPDYAIQYLEVIKHIFDIKGAVFVLAYDRSQLENSARSAFGKDLDFDEYLRKFVHREISLPALSDKGSQDLISAYIEYYLNRNEIRNCLLRIEKDRKKELIQLVVNLNLTLRQIQEAFRILGHLLGTSSNHNGEMTNWAFGVGGMIMVVLRIGNRELYNKLSSANLNSNEAVDFIQKVFGNENHITSWWFALLFSGGGIKRNPQETYDDIVSKLDNNTFVKRHSDQDFYRAWGYHYDTNNHFLRLSQSIDRIESMGYD